MPSDGKSSLGLWPGELKIYVNNKRFKSMSLFVNIWFVLYIDSLKLVMLKIKCIQ
jgi:hypothetical protein